MRSSNYIVYVFLITLILLLSFTFTGCSEVATNNTIINGTTSNNLHNIGLVAFDGSYYYYSNKSGFFKVNSQWKD